MRATVAAFDEADRRQDSLLRVDTDQISDQRSVVGS